MAKEMVYVIGAGGIGMPLAAFLAHSGAPVTAVRTSAENIEPQMIDVVIDLGEGRTQAVCVSTASLSKINGTDGGMIVVTAKATANRSIAPELFRRFGDLALVVLQNGIDVEAPFIEAGFQKVYRCIVYATGQRINKSTYRFREVAPSPIGVVHGDGEDAIAIAKALSTSNFRFRTSKQVERDVWKKAILNAAFNSICPLMNIDNGVFSREEDVARIAKNVLEEGSEVARRIGIDLEVEELMEQLLRISRLSDGQLISTLQDLNSGKETEINYLNLAISRVGTALEPPIDPKTTRILGELVLARSRIGRAVSLR
ncbi:ketopantoate reductase C-terminal domain-containing protein [uncultured Desulfuromusa sp.]|uniref:ketopantoate reductase family protein n=1 Tax=uncultured Desulfuromusa sp. TaxID=219183 RepID=UPI002AA7FF70|nr:ketopantoate reductase C-terminal domain-containing protein [uncultured Desulfuromusa sp.]